MTFAGASAARRSMKVHEMNSRDHKRLNDLEATVRRFMEGFHGEWNTFKSDWRTTMGALRDALERDRAAIVRNTNASTALIALTATIAQQLRDLANQGDDAITADDLNKMADDIDATAAANAKAVLDNTPGGVQSPNLPAGQMPGSTADSGTSQLAGAGQGSLEQTDKT